jgi:hypothetical protein
MILLGPLVLVGIIVAIVLAVQRGTHHDDTARLRSSSLPTSSLPSSVRDGSRPGARTRRPAALSDMLDRWVAEGLLTATQAHAIVEHERSAVGVPAVRRQATASGPGRRVPAYAEALGYLGGMLALAGLTLLVANYWPDMSTSIRLALSLVTSIVLVGAGALVHEHIDPALARLRWFLWTLASATAAVFTGVLMIATLEVDTAALVVAACAATVAFTSGLLWWGRDRPVQEFLVLGATIVSAATFVTAMTNGGLGGLTAWVLAAIVLAVGLRGLTPQPIIPHVVGTVALMVGAFVTVSTWMGAGALFVLATAAGLLLLAALPQLTMDLLQRIVLIMVGTFGALWGLPITLGYFGSEAGGATGLATWAVGAVLMAVGARRLLRAPIVAEVIGGLALIGGAALTAASWPSFAPLFGLATAVTLLMIGMLPGRVLYSLLGSLGLLINVPWTISTFFPGEGRAPLLILVSGVVIVVVAVLLARQGDRLRTELTMRPPDETPNGQLDADSSPVDRERIGRS